MTNKSTLVIDDDSDFLSLMCDKLESMGFHDLLKAADGEEAYDLLCKSNIGLIISDYMMPELDGLSLKEKINQDPRLKKIPMVMVSGYGTESVRDLAQSLGVLQWFDKPINEETFDPVVTDLHVKNCKS